MKPLLQHIYTSSECLFEFEKHDIKSELEKSNHEWSNVKLKGANRWAYLASIWQIIGYESSEIYKWPCQKPLNSNIFQHVWLHES